MLTTLERMRAQGRAQRLATWACVCLVMLLQSGSAFAGKAAPALQAHLQGKFVVFDQVGFEPDGDPLDRAVISATVRVAGPAGYRDLKLVLSMYLENFLPRTAPELPDLLHPDQVATSLAGFFQGKAALVGGDGRIAFWGSVLAEAFFDNTVHLALSLARTGAPAGEPALTMLGSFAVGNSLSVTGDLRATDGVTPAAATVLEAGGATLATVSWQSVIQNLAVSVPRMMGTGGAATPGASSTPADLSSSFARSSQLGSGARAPAVARQAGLSSSQRSARSASAPVARSSSSPSSALPVSGLLAGAGGGLCILLIAIALRLRPGRKTDAGLRQAG